MWRCQHIRRKTYQKNLADVDTAYQNIIMRAFGLALCHPAPKTLNWYGDMPNCHDREPEDTLIDDLCCCDDSDGEETDDDLDLDDAMLWYSTLRPFGGNQYDGARFED